MADPALLSKCTAKHAGRVALQLFSTWVQKHGLAKPTED